MVLTTFVLLYYCKRNYSYVQSNVGVDKASLNQRWDVIYQQILGTIQTGAPTVISTILLNLKLVSVYSVYNMVINGINGVLGIFISGLPAGFGELIAKGEKNKPLKTYASIHKNKDILVKSTSGGVFTALSDYVLDNAGTVYGAIFNDEFKVVHKRATNKPERDKMRGSKYVQSDMTGIYSCVKKDIKDGKLVLFTGTPCQADGLKRYLKGKPDNLIICDLICFGVPSPKVWKSYVEFISKINKSKLKEHYFRSYEKTWFESIALSVFENGKRYQDKGYSNIFTQLYYSKLADRPSCHKCPYTSVSRVSDITIADCRGIDKVIPTLKCDDGVSLVLVNTTFGENVYNNVLNNLNSIDIDLDTVIQPPLRSPAKINKKREDFFEVYNQKGFKKALDWYFGKYYILKQVVKKIIKKIKY